MSKDQLISLIITVRNEEKNIIFLLESLKNQTLLPSEIIITDADSSDNTVEKINHFAQKNPKLHLQVIKVPGNRSTGRNAAIRATKHELIAVTDAGCLPKPGWLESLYNSYINSSQEKTVVAGYAVGVPHSSFEEAVIPFFLIMPNMINPKTYLPTTRSLLMHKDRWEGVGGFNETFNTSEDFLFSNELQKHGVPIIFSVGAVVKWLPPKSYIQALKTFASFAACDVAGGVVRPKVLVLFGRYFLGVIVVGLLMMFLNFLAALSFIAVVIIGYSGWAMWKHRKYVKSVSFWQPLLQFGADFTVMAGSVWGVFQRLFR